MGVAETVKMLVLLLLAASSLVRSQANSECQEVVASDLGDMSGPSTIGLIADSGASGDGSVPPYVQLLQYKTVCLAVGETRDRYRFASVVARYNCSGIVSLISPIECDATGTSTYTAQFDLQCSAGPEWTLSFATGKNVFPPPHASFDTVLRKNCSICIDPDELDTVNVDTITHCAGKFWRRLLCVCI